MNKEKHVMNHLNLYRIVFAAFCIAGMLSACTVKLVSDYDASIKEETLEIAKKVDLFWGKLLDTEMDERKYASFKDQYNEIETDIRGLLMKNKIREQNEISTKQIENLLELWIEDKKIHKQNDTFSDFEAESHREQFVRVFTAIAKGEEAKNISS